MWLPNTGDMRLLEMGSDRTQESHQPSAIGHQLKTAELLLWTLRRSLPLLALMADG
jgi:hypothetical protein